MCAKAILKTISCVVVVAYLAGCSSNSSLAPFQPQTNNVANNFQMQATGVTDVTTILNYTWQNDGTTGNVNQATTVNKGTATLTIQDANGTQVYTKSLADNGTFTTSAGVAGNWKIRVNLSNYSGTLNFRIQKP